MAAAAGFSYGYAHESLFSAVNPNEVYQNLKSAGNLFLAEIIGWVIIFLCDILVSWSLYYYFKNVNKNISFGTALVRLLYSVFLGVAILQLFTIQNLSKNVSDVTNSVLGVTLHLNSFEKIWSLGLIIFGVHLIGLGYLSIRNFAVPKFWGWLLIFAGISYSVIHLTKNVMPNYITPIEKVETILSLPMAIAEIGFAVWLLARGGRAITLKFR